MHLVRGGSSIMGSLYKVLLARDSDPYMWSLFSLRLERGSASNMGPLFKVLLAHVSDPYMCFFFPQVHLARGSGSIMGSLVGGRGRESGQQDSLGSHSAFSEELPGRC